MFVKLKPTNPNHNLKSKFVGIHGNKQLIYGVMDVIALVHLKLLLNLIIIQTQPQTQLMSSMIVC